MCTNRVISLLVVVFGLQAASGSALLAQQFTCSSFSDLPDETRDAYVRGLVDGYQYAVAQIDASRESLQPPDAQADNPIREAMVQYGQNVLRDMVATMDLGALDLTYGDIAHRMSAICGNAAAVSRDLLSVFWEAVGQVRAAAAADSVNADTSSTDTSGSLH